MFVLRIEHPDTNEGPYNIPETIEDRYYEFLCSMSSDHSQSREHPGLTSMSKTLKYTRMYYGVPMDQFFCGFENKQQALDWFGRHDLEVLKDLGFHLQAYETKGYKLRDGKQVAFQKRRSVLLVENDWSLIGIS